MMEASNTPSTGNRFIYKLPLVNFLLAAVLGTVLRYYIFNPILNFNFLNWLQVHSHMMFLGWVSLALFILIFRKLDIKKYDTLIFYSIIVFELAALAMFVSFPMGGYGILSVVMLSMTMVVSLIFLWIISKRSARLQNAGWKFIRPGLLFMAISSIGPLALGPISAMGLKNTIWYNYAIYFYLHFQYNGWFFMAIIGLIILGSPSWEEKNRHMLERAAVYLSLAVVLTFFLSVLGHGNTLWVNVAGGTGAIIQLVVISRLASSFITYSRQSGGIMNEPNTVLLKLAILSLFLKLVLQVFSALPFLTGFIEGTRGVIISYLHLVLIGFVSFSILYFYIREKSVLEYNYSIPVFSYILIAGFFLNEFVLLVTVTGGIAIIVPQLLVVASVIMVTGIAGLLMTL